MTAQRIVSTLFGAFVGFWIARALFKWLLDVPSDIYVVLAVVFALAGAALGIAARLEEERERRGTPTS